MQKSLRNVIGPADIITVINASCGFLAILMLLLGQLRVSYALIFIALLADGIDGRIARRFRKSEMGEYLEAMADMASLSIAPLAFVFYMYYLASTSSLVLQYGLIFSCLVLLAASIFRLASFHLFKDTESFRGLPASASTIFLIVLSLVHVQLEVMLFVLCLLAVALVSPIRFPKPGSMINGVAAVLIILCLLFDSWYGYIVFIVLFCALLVYTLVGPFLVVQKKKAL